MYCPFPYPVIILYYLYKYKSIGNIYKLVQVYLYIFILVQPIIICYNNTCNRNGGGLFQHPSEGGVAYDRYNIINFIIGSTRRSHKIHKKITALYPTYKTVKK